MILFVIQKNRIIFIDHGRDEPAADRRALAVDLTPLRSLRAACARRMRSAFVIGAPLFSVLLVLLLWLFLLLLLLLLPLLLLLLLLLLSSPSSPALASHGGIDLDSPCA